MLPMDLGEGSPFSLGHLPLAIKEQEFELFRRGRVALLCLGYDDGRCAADRNLDDLDIRRSHGLQHLDDLFPLRAVELFDHI